MPPRFAINIVTHNSADQIGGCLDCVFRQRYSDYRVTVIDNGSRDGTLDALERWRERGVILIANRCNLYYARAHNQALATSESEWVMTLNPDVLIHPDYLAAVAEVFERYPTVGSVNGRLLLPQGAEFAPALFDRAPAPGNLIDGAGLAMRRSRRPQLRGNRQRHDRACLEPAFIFGADGACAAYRRSMLEDVAIDGECFDQDFVIYREDVDLAWRAQLFGWDTYYVPQALAYHRRGFHIGRGRRGISPLLRRHSVKNGWLLLLKNDDAASVLRHLPWIVPYQAKVVAGLLTVERSSLGAIADTARLRSKMLHKRRQIQRRRRRTPEELQRWFS